MTRTLHCNAWTTVDAPRKPPGKSADRGTKGHQYLYDAVTGDPTIALSLLSSRNKWLRSIDVTWLIKHIDGRPFRAELAMKYNIRTDQAEIIEVSGRNYPAPNPGDIFGTADLILGSRDSDTLIVIDYKTGKSVGPAGGSDQMRTLALMASRAYGAPSVRVQIFYINTDGSISIDEGAKFSAMDLDLIADEIRTAIEAPLTFSTGNWCDWCDANGLCEATK